VQCLQRHRDPATGTEPVVFSYFNQDQEVGCADLRTLRRRPFQDGAQEKLTKLWSTAACTTSANAPLSRPSDEWE
jgi:hypothetical protein